MTTEKNKEYVDAEILDTKNNFKSDSDFDSENIKNNFSKIKQTILMKGWLVLLNYLFVLAVFLGLFFGLIFLIFESPFDYIISIIVAFFIIRGIYKILKVFISKK